MPKQLSDQMIRRSWILALFLIVPAVASSAVVPQVSGVTSRLNVATWTGQQWIAAGDNGRILTSPDGSVWSSDSSGTTANLVGIATSGNTTVAIGSEAWSDTMAEPILNVVIVDGNPQFHDSGTAFVSLAGARGIAIASADGEKWQKTVFGSSLLESDGGCYGMVNTQSPTAIFWSGRRYVIFVQSAQGLTCLDTVIPPTPQPMRISSDGSTWQPGPTILSAEWTGAISAVSWAGQSGIGIVGQYVFHGSSDSTWSWNQSDSLPRNPGTPAALSTTSSGYVVVAGGGTIWKSVYGDAWVARLSGTTKNLNAVNHSGGWTTAAGDSGVLLASRDDSVWTSIPSGTLRNLRGIAANDSFFLVVGDSGTILRLPIASLMADGVREPAAAGSPVSLRITARRIEFSSSAESTREQVSLRITGLDGKNLWRATTSETGLDMPRLPAGSYLLRAEATGWAQALKFAIQ
jgi:hypothetical protein